MAIIIPDSPEIDNQRLKFDFIFYADAIADLISSCSKEPLSICINGPWGTGKTSLLYAIQRKLNEQKDRYTTVNFNAWKYSKSESLYASLLQRIFLAVANDNILEQLKQRYSNPFKKRYDLLRATVSTIGDVIGAKVDPEEYLKPSSFRDNLPFFDEFESVMNNVLQEQLKAEKKMVIFIDDLDRCTPTQTIEVLEAVKTFLDLENCVFVLAMDKSHAEASIKSHYGDIPIDKFEKKYLDKLIHITFDIPTIGVEDTEVFIKALIGSKFGPNLGSVSTLFIMVLEGNPRRIKRFVNQFNLIWSIVEKKSANSSKKITEYGLVEWLLLREAGLNLVIDLSEKNVEKQVEMFGNITKAAKASSSDIDKVIREYDLSIPSTDLSWSLLKEGKYNFAKNINEYIKLGRYFPVEVTTDTPKQTSFGILCEQLRKERGYSRAVMAEKMGDITPQAIITWERNGQIPKRDNIKKIKDGLELNETQYNELLSAAGYDTKKE